MKLVKRSASVSCGLGLVFLSRTAGRAQLLFPDLRV